MPKYYPVLLNLEGETVLVVGGGAIAARKASTMVEYGARVTVVAREAGPEVRELAHHGHIQLQQRPFDAADLDGARIVFAATDDEALHREIKRECDRRGLLCNVVDVPEMCSFITPSILRRGELMVTISTDGLCPAYAKYQRLRLEETAFPEGSEALLHVVAAARNELKGRKELTDEEKFTLLRRLIDDGLAERLERDGEDETRRHAVEQVRLRARQMIESKGATP